MPSDFAVKALNTVHRGLLALTRGRAGWRLKGMPVLELTTTGRKTGQPRSTMLTAPARQGSTLVVVASRGGDDRHPAWFLNLRANPEVQVSFQGRPRKRMLARIATAEERAQLWPGIAAAHPGYASYQDKTDREIPLVLLEEPAD